MRLSIIFAVLFILITIPLLFIYLAPFSMISFIESGNYNFSTNNLESEMQFYANMRFPSPEISYRIDGCNLKKTNDMELAFEIMQEITPLFFYPVESGEEISITCQDRMIPDGGGYFIAGEGGPKNITVAGKFHVITGGEILLIKDSTCARPNIAIHELMHVLGFEHSSNPNNIMYNITKCEQTLGDDMINLLNEIYSVPSYSDLAFENVSASMHGRFLNLNMTIRNIGLNDATLAVIDVYADGDLIKQFELESLEIGNGRFISVGNIWVTQMGIKEIELVINSGFSEIDKTNNKIKLEIENKN